MTNATKPIKVIKAAQVKKVEVNPKEVLELLRRDMRRRLRTIEAVFNEQIDLALRSLKNS